MWRSCMKGDKHMGKNILVISTSLRKNSNSEALADEFIKGRSSLAKAYAAGTVTG